MGIGLSVAHQLQVAADGIDCEGGEILRILSRCGSITFDSKSFANRLEQDPVQKGKPSQAKEYKQTSNLRQHVAGFQV